MSNKNNTSTSRLGNNQNVKKANVVNNNNFFSFKNNNLNKINNTPTNTSTNTPTNTPNTTTTNTNLKQNSNKGNGNKQNTNKLTNTLNAIENTKVEATKGMFNSGANTVSEYYETATGNETFMLIFKVILGTIFLIILINIVKYFYIKWNTNRVGSPILIDGSKNGKQAMVISQDPNHTNYVPINRSVNKDGIEFSYSTWFVISDLSYKNGEWKHMFHKGNSSSYPNRAPGVWIHPTNNAIRIYMNTMKEMLEYVDIDNIPLRKWVHMVIIVKNRSLNVYINGFLKIRKELSSLPRQNYGNVWINLFGGFDGYLSELQYFDHAVEPEEINSMVIKGPSKGSCIDTKERPPYLDDSWWLN
jgi:hypothetical protein